MIPQVCSEGKKERSVSQQQSVLDEGREKENSLTAPPFGTSGRKRGRFAVREGA